MKVNGKIFFRIIFLVIMTTIGLSPFILPKFVEWYYESPKIDFVLKNVEVKIEGCESSFDSELLILEEKGNCTIFQLKKPVRKWESKKEQRYYDLSKFIILGKKPEEFKGVTKFKKAKVAIYNHGGELYYPKRQDQPIAVKWKIE
ncbi:MAG: hypothetical protein PHT40_03380 [Patescibacteria group bacterium]|nr:hypothetical protein [Patescibacteria group bacterium]